MILSLFPLLMNAWLLDRSWRLIGRDLHGLDAYQLLRVPILLAAVIAGLVLLNPFMRFSYPHGLVLLLGLPLACLFPAVGRRPQRVAALAALACVTAFLPCLRLDPGAMLSATLGLLIFGSVLISLAAKKKADTQDSPQRIYRDRLPLMAVCALCGLCVACWGMSAFAMDTNSGDRLLSLLTLPAALPVLNLIPKFGKDKSSLIVLTSLGMLPAILWPLAFMLLMMRAFS